MIPKKKFKKRMNPKQKKFNKKKNSKRMKTPQQIKKLVAKIKRIKLQRIKKNVLLFLS